jgi:hypothetical protein
MRVEGKESRPMIWIIGNNVLMDGIAASLQEKQIKNLVHWEKLDVDFDAKLRSNTPNLIIFELDTPGSYILLALLRQQPGIQLIGVDQNCEQVIVLNSFQRQSHSMRDLHQIVQEVTKSGDISRKEDQY